MNDFTKEELERIYYILTHYDIRDAHCINKIKSMIDNYCEHEADHVFYLTNPVKQKCYKCGRYF